jgi:hypothetical protein
MTRLLRCALLMLLSHQVANAAELGRLFLDADERAAIDAARLGSAEMRQAGAKAQPESSTVAGEPALPPAPATPVKVNVYIARSAGAPTVWVNGSDMAPGTLSPPARDGRRVRVRLSDGGGQVALKPGQSFDPGSREVSDAYQQRPPAQQ